MTMRLLLPFQHGLNVEAIEQAIRLAKGHDATLIPLSLIPMSEKSYRKGARLDLVQQSKDFLETVKHKARAYAVPLESVEVYTHHPVQSIHALVTEMHCDGIALFLGYRSALFLPQDAIGRLVEEATCKLYIMHLPVQKRVSLAQKVRVRLTRWLPRKPALQDVQLQAREVLSEETPQTVEA